jgi:quercetin dioxygenase-like cupin family protein
VISLALEALDFSAAWVEGEDGARWQSAAGHGAKASGSSVIRLAAGCHLPRHTDSAEETIVVVAGTAELEVAGERGRVTAGGLAVVPEDAPHTVRNAGDDTLTFVAVYAASEVVTRYEREVQPDGSRERQTVG